MQDPVRKPSRHPDRRTASAIALLLLAGACVSGARAARLPPDYVSASVDIRSLLTTPVVNESGPQTGSLASETGTASGTSARGSTVAGSGFASADAHGNLKVFASDAVTTASNEVFNMNVTSVADRVDTFTFLPAPGTSISFVATLDWSGPSVPSCPPGSDCIVNIIDHLNENGFVAIDNSLYYDSTDPHHLSLPGSQRIQEIWTFTAPASFVLDEQLYLGVQVDANEGVSTKFVADLAHTGHFYLDPLTPGASYTTASGNMYFTPSVAVVPEPGRGALFCAGLIWACMVGTRRRGSARPHCSDSPAGRGGALQEPARLLRHP